MHGDSLKPAPAHTEDAALAAPPDEQNPAIKDAVMTMWVIAGAIALWSAGVYFFIL